MADVDDLKRLKFERIQMLEKAKKLANDLLTENLSATGW